MRVQIEPALAKLGRTSFKESKYYSDVIQPHIRGLFQEDTQPIACTLSTTLPAFGLRLLTYFSHIYTMLQIYTVRALNFRPFHKQLALVQSCKAYSSRPETEDDDKDLDTARQWFAKFNKNTIPEKISTTEYSKASGSGGQKTNKYVSRWLHLGMDTDDLKDGFKSYDSLENERP